VLETRGFACEGGEEGNGGGRGRFGYTPDRVCMEHVRFIRGVRLGLVFSCCLDTQLCEKVEVLVF
jgi:hypothetical protein